MNRGFGSTVEINGPSDRRFRPLAWSLSDWKASWKRPYRRRGTILVTGSRMMGSSEMGTHGPNQQGVMTLLVD
jgi:hypothetical protein